MSLELAHIAHGESRPAGRDPARPARLGAQLVARFARQLGATHRVFALDLRNHGASPLGGQR